MDGLRQYVISIVAVALICSILMGLIQNGFAKELIKLLCGLFLALTIIHPIKKMDFNTITVNSLNVMHEAEEAAAMGENVSGEIMRDIIKAEAEAYILDKAAEMNAELNVDITVDTNKIPVSAELSGKISPYARERIESILESDLGITKENQAWTG